MKRKIITILIFIFIIFINVSAYFVLYKVLDNIDTQNINENQNNVIIQS